MIVSVVLDTEYMGKAERNKWFLKSISSAIRQDTIVVTHSYFRDNLNDIIDNCPERFFVEFEMEHVSVEEINELSICYIPDILFENMYLKFGSRTKQLSYLFNERDLELENYIISYIDSELRKRGNIKPTYILNCLHTFRSIKYLAEYYGCPLIPYVFSAVRKVHGYSQTLYMSHIDCDLFNSNACKILYDKRESDDIGFPIFNKMELLALLGKKHNMPLLPLMKRKGKYEVGVVGEGFRIIPEIYQKDKVTDDDLYYEINRFFDPRQVITRQHPLQLDQVGLGRKHVKNDPAAFLLSCNRIITVQSQMIMKAAMWNRRAVAMSTALPYSFLLNSSVIDAKRISDFDLNFILFAYFVPDVCMFDQEYWMWRLNNPEVKEITIRNMSAILKNLNIPFSKIKQSKNRIEEILLCRGFTKIEIEKILNVETTDDVPYDYPTSCLQYSIDGNIFYSLYCLNHCHNEEIISVFNVPKDAVEVRLIPQNDIDGFITIKYLTLNGENMSINIHDTYFFKNEPVFKLLISGRDGEKILKCTWKIKSAY